MGRVEVTPEQRQRLEGTARVWAAAGLPEVAEAVAAALTEIDALREALREARDYVALDDDGYPRHSPSLPKIDALLGEHKCVYGKAGPNQADRDGGMVMGSCTCGLLGEKQQ